MRVADYIITAMAVALLAGTVGLVIKHTVAAGFGNMIVGMRHGVR